MDSNYSIGSRVREYRRAKGLSQEELAFRAEISTVYLRRIEKDLTNPTIATVMKLCKALMIQVSDLCEDMHTTPSASGIDQQILMFLSDKSERDKKTVLDLLKIVFKLNKSSR